MPTAGVAFPDKDFVVDGETYYVDGDIVVEYEWVDNGIGPYEAWGRRGNDVRMGVGEMRVIAAEDVCRYDANEDDVVLLTRGEQDAIQPKVVAAVQEAMEADPRFLDAVADRVHDAHAG